MVRRYALVLLPLLLLVPGVQAKTHKHSKHHKHLHKVSKADKPTQTAKLKKDRQEEKQLRALAKRIDGDTRNLSDDSHVQLLADQFDVPLTVIEDLRQQGQSWGNITVVLAMAHSLTVKDPVHNQGTADAILQVQTARSLAKSWADVAHSTGIEMHWVVLTVAHSHKSVIARLRAAPTLALASN